jgi:RNA polymerase sigma-70 factor (ECF subfamily)
MPARPAAREQKTVAGCSEKAARGRRSSVGTEQPAPGVDPVVAVYRRALPQVYGYLLPRCGSAALAEDLTAETFMAAVAAVRQRGMPEVTVAWLVAVARHKLVDHWRRTAREQRGMAAAAERGAGRAASRAADRMAEPVDDPWEGWLDAEAAFSALSRLPGPQRAALTLRYLDGLPVTEVGAHLGRSVHATETLLVRARAALRRVYREEGRDA